MDMATSMSMVTSTTMSMAMSATATAAVASSASAMDMDMGAGSCSISMLWNWTTVGACFLSSSWHIRTRAAFGGSVVGIFLLCMAIEGVRRIGREYDRRLTRQAIALASGKDARLVLTPSLGRYTVPWPQQVIRGFLYGSQFTAAFLVMLLGMYFNGFILFAIFAGQMAGYILFARDTARYDLPENAGVDSGCCC
ncbi:copper transporter complex subunit Ctr4 [Cryptotrichosporon argae]